MSFESLKTVTDRGEVILVRHCSIEAPNGEVGPLTLTFTRPVPHEDLYWGSVRMACEHFDTVERFSGEDEVGALCRLMWIGRIVLELREADGYSIWHQVKGDLHYFDFWSGSEFQQEFCLPSAYTAAKETAFYKANVGKALFPSHRVGIESDRPAITIYKVNEDGTDRVGCVIGADEMKGHTWESLEQLVGKRILWDSKEGVELMIALQPNRRDAD